MSSVQRPAAVDGIASQQAQLCYICLGEDEGGGNLGDRLQHGGCGCRGSAGYAHLRCFVQAATHNRKRWLDCPTCGQEFTGTVQLGLARAHWDRVVARPAGDAERQFAQDALAQALWRGGNYAEALPLFEDNLAVSRQTLGDTHTETLICINNLANLLDDMGDSAAEPLHREALAVRRAQWGAEHTETLQSMHNLGSYLLKDRRYDEAGPLLLETVGARRRVLGGNHVATLDSTEALAGFYEQQGDFAKAEPLYRASVAGKQRVLGIQNSATLLAMNNLLILLHRKGDLVEAEALAVSVLEGRRIVLGDAHEETQKSIHNLATIRQAMSAGHNSGELQQSDALAVGEAVKVIGLSTSTEYNGQRGMVLAFDATKGRYNVRLDERPRPIRIKRANLQRC